MTDGSIKSVEQGAPAGATRRDAAVGAVLVVLGIGVIVLGFQVPPGVQTDPLGPGAFPIALGAAIAVCGLLLGATALLGDRWSRSAPVFVESGADGDEGGRLSPGRLGGAIAATAVYLFAFERLGYLLATPLYAVVIMVLQPDARGRAVLTAPVLVTVALYAAFRFGLLIPVPDGILESWLPW
jgi:hypothetical protein